MEDVAQKWATQHWVNAILLSCSSLSFSISQNDPKWINPKMGVQKNGGLPSAPIFHGENGDYPPVIKHDK